VPPFQLFDGTVNGLLLVDGDGVILGTNTTARDIIEASPFIRIEDGKLVADDRIGLTHIIKRAAAEHGRACIMEIRPKERSKPLFLLAGRVEFNLTSLLPSDSVIAVIIGDPEFELKPNVDVLRQLFGLTPRESIVAAMVMNGHGSSDIVRELRISANTARGYLKSLMSKTGVRRQCELMRVLLSSPALAYPHGLHFAPEWESRLAEGITMLVANVAVADHGSRRIRSAPVGNHEASDDK
jgi:DNA-binding CsgD family transcriptional regulator